MVIVSIFAYLILVFSFIGGIKEGVVKSFFSLITLVISLPIASKLYYLIASLLSFIPGEDWENFIGFFITLAIVSVILHFIFFMPRKILHKIFGGGCVSRPFGGVINLFNSAIGLTAFALVLLAFPVWGWLEQALRESAIMSWLVINLNFVQALITEVSRQAAGNIPV